jgi:hypothetical protein
MIEYNSSIGWIFSAVLDETEKCQLGDAGYILRAVSPNWKDHDVSLLRIQTILKLSKRVFRECHGTFAGSTAA